MNVWVSGGVCEREREDSYVFILWPIIIWPNFKSLVYLPNVFLTKINSEKTYWDRSKLILTIAIPMLFSGKSVIWMPDWTPGANEQCDRIPPARPDPEPRGTEAPVRSVTHLYFPTVAGNLLITVIVTTSRALGSPMYCFLSFLSFIDCCYSRWYLAYLLKRKPSPSVGVWLSSLQSISLEELRSSCSWWGPMTATWPSASPCSTPSQWTGKCVASWWPWSGPEAFFTLCFKLILESGCPVAPVSLTTSSVTFSLCWNSPALPLTSLVFLLLPAVGWCVCSSFLSLSPPMFSSFALSEHTALQNSRKLSPLALPMLL